MPRSHSKKSDRGSRRSAPSSRRSRVDVEERLSNVMLGSSTRLQRGESRDSRRGSKHDAPSTAFQEARMVTRLRLLRKLRQKQMRGDTTVAYQELEGMQKRAEKRGRARTFDPWHDLKSGALTLWEKIPYGFGPVLSMECISLLIAFYGFIVEFMQFGGANQQKGALDMLTMWSSPELMLYPVVGICVVFASFFCLILLGTRNRDKAQIKMVMTLKFIATMLCVGLFLMDWMSMMEVGWGSFMRFGRSAVDAYQRSRGEKGVGPDVRCRLRPYLEALTFMAMVQSAWMYWGAFLESEADDAAMRSELRELERMVGHINPDDVEWGALDNGAQESGDDDESSDESSEEDSPQYKRRSRSSASRRHKQEPESLSSNEYIEETPPTSGDSLESTPPTSQESYEPSPPPQRRRSSLRQSGSQGGYVGRGRVDDMMASGMTSGVGEGPRISRGKRSYVSDGGTRYSRQVVARTYNY